MYAQTGEAHAKRTRMRMNLTCRAEMSVKVDYDPGRDESFPCAPNMFRVEIDHISEI
jgi:hypothetical protein